MSDEVLGISIDELEPSVLSWLNTFAGEAFPSVDSLESLADGLIFANVLYEFSPTHFPRDFITHEHLDNKLIRKRNISTLCKFLGKYYKELGAQVDLVLPDPSEISSGSKFALLSVAVAILGTISVCDGKERLIRVILDQVKGDQLSTLMRVVQSAQESYQFSVPSHSEESANSTSPFEDQDRSTTNTSFLNTTGISSASVSAVERENAELRRIIESHERDMAALSMNLEVSTREIEELKEKLEVASHERDESIAKNRVQDAVRLEAQVEELENRLTLSEQEKTDLLASVKQLENVKISYEDASKNIESLKNQLKQVEESLDAERSKTAEFARKEKQSIASSKLLEKISELESRNAELERDRDQERELRRSLEEEIAELKKQRSSLQQYKIKFEKLEEDVRSTEASHRASEETLTSLREQLEGAMERVAASETTNRKLQLELQEIRGNHLSSDLTRGSEGLASKSSDLLSELQEAADADVDELKESLRGKEMQIHSLKEEMRRLKLQYESDTDQMREYELIFKETQAKNVDLQKEIINLNTKLRENESVSASNIRPDEGSVSRILQLEQQNNALLSKVNELEKLEAQLVNATRFLEEKNKAMEDELESVSNKNIDLEKSLRKLQNQEHQLSGERDIRFPREIESLSREVDILASAFYELSWEHTRERAFLPSVSKSRKGSIRKSSLRSADNSRGPLSDMRAKELSAFL